MATRSTRRLLRTTLCPSQLHTSLRTTLYTVRYLRTSSALHEQLSPQSPLKVFLDTFKSEVKKSKELETSVKALQDSSGHLGESEAFKKAKDALEKASIARTKTAAALGTGLHKTWESAPVRMSRKAVSGTTHWFFRMFDIIMKPITGTRLYQSIRDSMVDGASSRYGFYGTKEERRKARALLEMQERLNPKSIRYEPNTEETRVVLHNKLTIRDRIRMYKNQSKLFRKWEDFKIYYQETEHPILSSVRDMADSISSFWYRMFSETEASQVVSRFKEIDPSFNSEVFQRYLREYIIPEVSEAYVKGDKEALRTWFSEAPFSVWETTTKEYAKHGVVSAGQVLDIRGVDIASYRMLQPNNIPVMVITFRTQEVHLFKNAKSGEVVAGRNDRIQQCTYAIVMTRLEEQLDNKETKGWCIVDFARARAVDYN
ncbi:TIM23 translocase complex subunit Tim44 [Schizosaccharomyces japonicus yFS275]|uniref:Mitochondrial import inner membrane translocase subunit TIM44 n=1 Tax=Schizosaccharomyces japonicus (strain yFS275 / FY16936) TaxID=402676 RepID=B6JZN5_SCHJY|nr:TIM23 translocase complex subunit Tim44 [Schizosaccharomyces japonicus yFS275]EEB07003.1 TIM23 translocase complex subunit Tim44 [Schizosaccharomyces japonicus yFS275]